MPTLQETIDRLTSSFAEDVIKALRGIQLSELMELQNGGRRDRGEDGRRQSGKAAPSREQAKKPRPRATRAEAVVLDERALDAATEFFAQRGPKGATAVQAHDHLESLSFATPVDIVEVLLERGVLRDAGFRRTTGSGTAAVWVLAAEHPETTIIGA